VCSRPFAARVSVRGAPTFCVPSPTRDIETPAAHKMGVFFAPPSFFQRVSLSPHTRRGGKHPSFVGGERGVVFSGAPPHFILSGAHKNLLGPPPFSSPPPRRKHPPPKKGRLSFFCGFKKEGFFFPPLFFRGLSALS